MTAVERNDQNWPHVHFVLLGLVKKVTWKRQGMYETLNCRRAGLRLDDGPTRVPPRVRHSAYDAVVQIPVDALHHADLESARSKVLRMTCQDVKSAVPHPPSSQKVRCDTHMECTRS